MMTPEELIADLLAKGKLEETYYAFYERPDGDRGVHKAVNLDALEHWKAWQPKGTLIKKIERQFILVSKRHIYEQEHTL
jgi:hypothetical protein